MVSASISTAAAYALRPLLPRSFLSASESRSRSVRSMTGDCSHRHKRYIRGWQWRDRFWWMTLRQWFSSAAYYNNPTSRIWPARPPRNSTFTVTLALSLFELSTHELGIRRKIVGNIISEVPVGQDTSTVNVDHLHVLSALTGDNSARSSLLLASVDIKVDHTRAKNINLRSILLDDIQETARCRLP
jgi:hypothetical protein